ncbi:hypothetical protein C8F01DRAFT_1255063 [Mycena amicta]|nr:hypothetical protein C8F01DRAFT_1255063 [Mycena amicta]
MDGAPAIDMSESPLPDVPETSKRRQYKPVPRDARKSNKGWADGPRSRILQPHVERFAQTLSFNWRTNRDYAQRVCNEYHSLVSWRLRPDEDPVLPDVLPPYDPLKKPPPEELTPEEEQIVRYLKYHARKIRGQYLRPDEKSPYSTLFHKLDLVEKPSKARPLYLKEKERLEELNPGGKSITINAPFRAKVMKAVWDGLDAAERQGYLDRAQAEAAERRAQYKLWKEMGVPQTGEFYELCILRFKDFFFPIAEKLAEYTGCHVFCMIGGPRPSKSGEIWTTSMYHGENKADVPLAWPQVDQARFGKEVVGFFKEYLETAFTDKDKQRVALRSEDTSPGAALNGQGEFDMDKLYSLDRNSPEHDAGFSVRVTLSDMEDSGGESSGEDSDSSDDDGGRPSRKAAGKTKVPARGKGKGKARARARPQGSDDDDDDDDLPPVKRVKKAPAKAMAPAPPTRHSDDDETPTASGSGAAAARPLPRHRRPQRNVESVADKDARLKREAIERQQKAAADKAESDKLAEERRNERIRQEGRDILAAAKAARASASAPSQPPALPTYVKIAISGSHVKNTVSGTHVESASAFARRRLSACTPAAPAPATSSSTVAESTASASAVANSTASAFTVANSTASASAVANSTASAFTVANSTASASAVSNSTASASAVAYSSSSTTSPSTVADSSTTGSQ